VIRELHRGHWLLGGEMRARPGQNGV
jgi:hypothetical protein